MSKTTEQREIKFRIWNGFKMEHNIMAGFLGSFYVQGMDEKDSASMSHFNTKYQSETPLMQYTSLKDKNGVEIYEGDILLSDDNDEPFLPVEFSQVEIGKDSWGMSHTALCWNVGYRDLSGRSPIINGNYGDGMYGQYDSELTVIGNIHQNPELLTT